MKSNQVDKPCMKGFVFQEHMYMNTELEIQLYYWPRYETSQAI